MPLNYSNGSEKEKHKISGNYKLVPSNAYPRKTAPKMASFRDPSSPSRGSNEQENIDNTDHQHESDSTDTELDNRPRDTYLDERIPIVFEPYVEWWAETGVAEQLSEIRVELGIDEYSTKMAASEDRVLCA